MHCSTKLHLMSNKGIRLKHPLIFRKVELKSFDVVGNSSQNTSSEYDTLRISLGKHCYHFWMYLCGLWFLSLLLEARHIQSSFVKVTSIQCQSSLDWIRAGELNVCIGISSLAGRTGLDKTNLRYGTTLR